MKYILWEGTYDSEKLMMKWYQTKLHSVGVLKAIFRDKSMHEIC